MFLIIVIRMSEYFVKGKGDMLFVYVLFDLGVRSLFDCINYILM